MTRTTNATVVLAVTVLALATVAAAPTTVAAGDSGPSVDHVGDRDDTESVPDDCRETATESAPPRGDSSTPGQTTPDDGTAEAGENATCRPPDHDGDDSDCERPERRSSNASDRREPNVVPPDSLDDVAGGPAVDAVERVGFGLGWILSNFTPGTPQPTPPVCEAAPSGDDDAGDDDGHPDWSPSATDDDDGDDESGTARRGTGSGPATGGESEDCGSDRTAPGDDGRPVPPAGSTVPDRCG